VDRESALKEVWRAELVARLALLDHEISEQATRTEFVRVRGWDSTTFEKRSQLLQATRAHYVALLKLLLVEGKCPMLWNDLDPDAASDAVFVPVLRPG
jgi:hypothetical protein